MDYLVRSERNSAMKRTIYSMVLILLALFILSSTAFSGALLTYPKFQAWSDSGKILTNGKLYTYYPYTTTPKEAYTDKSLTTPAANPIILNARGEATVYLSGMYKLVLKSSDNSTIWTQDNVVGSYGGDFTDNSTCVYVENYGAVCDNETNDTEFFESAITALPVGGGKICVSTKTCLVNLTITKPNVWIDGSTQGGPNSVTGIPTTSALRPYDTSKPVIQVGNDTVLVPGFRLSNINLYGANTGQYGIYLAPGSYQGYYQNVTVGHFTGYGIKVGSSTHACSYPISFNYFDDLIVHSDTPGAGDGIVLYQGGYPASGSEDCWNTELYFNNFAIHMADGTGYAVKNYGVNPTFNNGWIQTYGGQGILLDEDGTAYPKLFGSTVKVEVEGGGVSLKNDTNLNLHWFILVRGNDWNFQGSYQDPTGALWPFYSPSSGSYEGHFWSPKIYSQMRFGLTADSNDTMDYTRWPFINNDGVYGLDIAVRAGQVIRLGQDLGQGAAQGTRIYGPLQADGIANLSSGALIVDPATQGVAANYGGGAFHAYGFSTFDNDTTIAHGDLIVSDGRIYDNNATHYIYSKGGFSCDEPGKYFAAQGGAHLLAWTGAWDSSHLMLGAYHFWMTASGKLKINDLAPVSDDNGTTVWMGNKKTPATSSEACVAGEMAWDDNYTYVCRTTNQWRRSAHATW
jgi:hypothetical protein